MKKFNFINYSIPLNQWKVDYSNYEEMRNMLKERVVDRLFLNDVPVVDWNPKTVLFKLQCEFRDNGDIRQESGIDAPRYAMRQLFSDILGVGDITKFLETCQYVDEKREGHPLEDYCMDKSNAILDSIWDIKRRKNPRTKRVIAHRVEDIFGVSIRAFVTRDYVYKPDINILEMAENHMKTVDESLEFVNGYATPLLSIFNFANTTPKLFANRPTLVGVSVFNSEFKYSSAGVSTWAYFKDWDISLTGTTRNFVLRVPHRGAEEQFKNRLKLGIKSVFDRGTALQELFNGLTRGDLIEVDIDLEKKDERDKYLLGSVLGIRKTQTIKDIAEIRNTKDYPMGVDGVIFSLLDFVKNNAKTESERKAINNKAMDILLEPERFIKEMGREITRSDVIEIDDDVKEEKKDTFASMDEFIDLDLDF